MSKRDPLYRQQPGHRFQRVYKTDVIGSVVFVVSLVALFWAVLILASWR